MDISPDEEINPDIEGWQRTICHMQQLTFSPEIRRRRAANEIDDNFILWAAQLIQPHGGGQIIRLNEEVRGVQYIRVGRPIEKGEQIQLSDLANLETFDLLDDELDCGHFTIFWTGSGWIGTFDFRSGRAKCLALIEKASKFVSAAKLSISNQLSDPATDMLYTACELLAKVHLILAHLPADEWKTHKNISSHVNIQGRIGNIDSAFVNLFNCLYETRNHAKYATGYVSNPPTFDDLELADAMAARLRESASQRRPDRDRS
jgi:hypothetical protein